MKLETNASVKKLQAAVDFVMSYGIALIIIIVALTIIYRVGTSNQGVAAPACIAVPGFTCDFFSIDTNGVLVIRLSQAVGTPIYINGAACSTQLNATGNKPQYGNIHVSNVLPGNYPTAAPYSFTPGNAIYSGASYVIYTYCYGPFGISKGQLGSSFTGYIWLNYTINTYGRQTQRIASVTAPYT